jgi:hypothetical protein
MFKMYKPYIYIVIYKRYSIKMFTNTLVDLNYFTRIPRIYYYLLGTKFEMFIWDDCKRTYNLSLHFILKLGRLQVKIQEKGKH